MKRNKVFHYYRMVGARRVRYRMVLDHTNTLLENEPVDQAPTVHDHTMFDRADQLPDTQAARQSAQILSLRERGFEFQVNEDGQLRITGIPLRERLIAQFYTLAAPCFFPGCEVLRGRWEEMLAQGGGEDCTDCEKGKLMQQFRDTLIPFIDQYMASHEEAKPSG